MFTLKQIDDIHNQFGQADTLLQYLQALHEIGVTKSDSFLTDGHTAYYADNGASIASTGVHEMLTIAESSDRKSLLEQLNLHKEGTTNYLEMSKGLAKSGVEKWTFDTINPSITYYDKDGNALLTERIK